MTTLEMQYRYVLTRDVAPLTGEGTVLFVMLNPSTADEWADDPTIRRCKGFAESWGYARLEVVNLFPFRATSPADLHRASEGERLGAWPDRFILLAMGHADLIVRAWGANGERYADRIDHVTHLLKIAANAPQVHLGLTVKGLPRHPLMVRADVQPTPIPVGADF